MHSYYSCRDITVRRYSPKFKMAFRYNKCLTYCKELVIIVVVVILMGQP